LAHAHANLFATVGVHPDYEDTLEPDIDWLVSNAADDKVIGIGETGLDYFRLQGDLEWQRERFRIHIRAAVAAKKPLIVHTRSASEDTIRLLKEEGADRVGGVLHCFTESWEVAQAGMEMGFYISFSGIVTFKNAESLRDVARRMPLDRMLIETDSPYVAPVPFRGKTNEPSFVPHVAARIALERETSAQEIAAATTANFQRLFKLDLNA
jgi:TatD DNase family protein